MKHNRRLRNGRNWKTAFWVLGFVGAVHAQDSGEDFPFEDFPDFDSPSAGATSSPGASSGGNAATGTSGGEDFSELEDAFYDPFEEGATASSGQAPAPNTPPPATAPAPPPASQSTGTAQSSPAAPAPEQLTVTTPAPPDPALSQPTNTVDFGGQESLLGDGSNFPDDIRALEERLKGAEAAYGEERIRQEGLGDPGENLAPSDKFARVPLRPPMSDANWVRWVGPLTQKDYKIRRGDSLWTVSERLFGNPHLWPKIWQLNARITNPHIIERGMTLNFSPGNPGSAPELAFRNDPSESGKDVSIYPLTKLEKKRTLLELIDETLRRQISTSHPPFQYFLLDNKPQEITKLPPVLERSGRRFFVEGDRFRLDIPDGVFPIVRTRVVTERFVRGHRVRWLGLVSVRNKQAEIVKAFAELEAGDEVVRRRFQLSPLAIHRDTLGPEYREETSLVMLEDGAETHGGHGNMMGVLFPAIGVGPRPGALLEVQVGATRRVQALLVDRDQRFGTLWIVDGDQEVSLGDKIF